MIYRAGNMFARFLHSQVAGSIVLLAATLTAVVWANSPWSDIYHKLSHLDIGAIFGGQRYHLSLDHWVKDGLMAIFFFVVGLEIKREILAGELSSFSKAILPVFAAIGGAVAPAVIYLFINGSGPGAQGWGVSMATDIAFALGVLAFFGKRVPVGLKVFLTALAIVDDLLAVIVIAFFYTASINFTALGVAAVLLLFLWFGIRKWEDFIWLHLLTAFMIWLAFFMSGVHATIAGVLIAMTVPVKASVEPAGFLDEICARVNFLKDESVSRLSLVRKLSHRNALENIYVMASRLMPPGIRIEEQLHSVQAFIILPLFALFSAGVTLNSEMLGMFPTNTGTGIIFGLVLGKMSGIFMSSFFVVKSGLAKLPDGVGWGSLLGVAALGGIGFTMSIFISELAFTDAAMLDDAKLSIFIASISAAGIGAFILDRTLETAEKP